MEIHYFFFFTFNIIIINIHTVVDYNEIGKVGMQYFHISISKFFSF